MGAYFSTTTDEEKIKMEDTLAECISVWKEVEASALELVSDSSEKDFITA